MAPEIVTAEEDGRREEGKKKQSSKGKATIHQMRGEFMMHGADHSAAFPPARFLPQLVPGYALPTATYQGHLPLAAAVIPPLRTAALNDVKMSFCLPIVSLTNHHTMGHALKSMSITPTYAPMYASLKSSGSHLANQIDRAIHLNYERRRISSDFVNAIHQLICTLEHHFSHLFKAQVKLQLYGSLLNGFGTESCDADLSLFFLDRAPDWATSDTVMRLIAAMLTELPGVLEPRFIAAKVPIVRFRCVDMESEIDISYNNQLAIHNTCLLKQYTQWDAHRIPVLGVFIKKWAKTNHIGDASQGGLSSYGWMIMAIYYLQTLSPFGLLPILQECQNTGPLLVNGWNVAYSRFIDVSHAPSIHGSVYDFFMGFLKYFANHFDYEHSMIQISYRPMTIKPPHWRRYPMTIEDPFEKTHNLAQGISPEMLTYIKSCLLKTLAVFSDASNVRAFLEQSDDDPIAAEQRLAQDDEFALKLGDYLLSLSVPSLPPPLPRRSRRRTNSMSFTLSDTSL